MLEAVRGQVNGEILDTREPTDEPCVACSDACTGLLRCDDCEGALHFMCCEFDEDDGAWRLCVKCLKKREKR